MAFWLSIGALAGCDSASEGSPPPAPFLRIPDIHTGEDGFTEACASCRPWENCAQQACSCSPRCTDATACLPDDCGGTCACPEGYVETPGGVFTPEGECHDTCLSADWECGTLCGMDCGGCVAGETCVLGRCECLPQCDGTRCDDGCGGYCPCADGSVCNAQGACLPPELCTDSCTSENLACGEMCGISCGTCAENESCLQGSCAEQVSCADCPLSLRLEGKTLQGGKLRWVTLSVEYAPTDTEPRPRMADLRIAASRPVWLKSAVEGPALTQANKSLVRFEPWDDPWRKMGNGEFQLLAYEPTNTERLADGEVVRLTFALEEWGPVTFSLQRREQTFAPPDSDSALQASAYDGNVIVTR